MLAKDLSVGEKIVILEQTNFWGNIRKGDIGTVVGSNRECVLLYFNYEEDEWKLDKKAKEGCHFTVYIEDFITF